MSIATSNNEEQKAYHILRITDINKEPFDTLSPISGYEDMLLVSLETAVEPLVPFLPDIQSYASKVKERCRKKAVDRLSNDESASIMLYTMGWKPLDQCLHIALNNTLRSKERNQLEPWFLYLKLFLTALSRLPSVHQKIYCQIDLDLSKQYKLGETIVWREFSSCTTSIDVFQSEQCSNLTERRTLLTIECHSGKNIRQHSYFQLEDEILLFPFTQFKVEVSSDQDNGIHSIQLAERQLSSSQSNKLVFNKLTYVAKFDFNGLSSAGKLTFRQGDQLTILDRYSYSYWWYGKNLRTKQVGYVPKNYLSAVTDLTAYEWYFTKTNRHDAEQFLEQEYNGKGTFLIRPSDTNEDEESLSILDFNANRHFHVKHYRVRRTDQGLYYISKENSFSSLQDLVKYYQTTIAGLCCLLTNPCQKIEPIDSVNQYDLLELDRSQLLSTQLLHRENSVEFYKGIYGQRHVTIKYIKKDHEDSIWNIDKFIKEAKLMKKLSHKNLVRLYGVCTQQQPILIVTELLIYGSLLTYLRDLSRQNLNLKTKIDFILQIIDGMIYLEEKGYLHGDLAARNIFLGEFNLIKIGGFTSMEMNDQESQFSIKWTAPEILTKKECTTKSDVWSFAILLYEIITHGANPYPGISDNQILPLVLDGYRMSKPNDCDEEYYQIMSDCWEDNPDHRPTFEILSERFKEYLIQQESIYHNEIYTEC